MDNILYCVYFHKRNDNHEIFYVGKGTMKDRPYTSRSRNILWKFYAGKYGFTTEIAHDDLSFNVALRVEARYIKQFGRINNGTGILTNMSDGGIGAKGAVWSSDSRRKMSEIMRVEARSENRLAAAAKRKGIPLVKKAKAQYVSGADHGMSKKVINITNSKVYNSITEAAKDTGVSRQTIFKWVKGRAKIETYFRYYDEYIIEQLLRSKVGDI